MRRADITDAARHLVKALIDLEDAEERVARQRRYGDHPDAPDWRPGDAEGLTVARALTTAALSTLKSIRGDMWDLAAVRDATLAVWRAELEGRTAEPELRKYWGDDEFERRYSYGEDGRLRPMAAPFREG